MDEALRMSGQYMSSPHILSQWLWIVALALARTAPVVWITPFGGGQLVPAIAKIGLALAFGSMALPLLIADSASISSLSTAVLICVLIKELLIGSALAFLVALVFWGLQGAGVLIDTLRGSNLAEVLAPDSGTRTSPLAVLFFYLAVAIFFAVGGHRLFFTTLAASYTTIPLLNFPASQNLGAFALLCAQLTAVCFSVALAYAAPVMVALLLTDVCLGWINRFVPQISIHFVAMPLRGFLGVVILIVALTAIGAMLPTTLMSGVKFLEQGLYMLGR